MSVDTSCPSSSQLRALTLGTLAGPDVQRLQGHINQCTPCRSLLQQLSAYPKTEPVANLADLPTLEGPAPAVAEPKDSQVVRTVDYSFLLPPVEPDEIGRLNNYRVLDVLGRGGMGIVFRAEDIALRRPVALKVMKPELKRDPDGWQRFLREARTMAAIKHDHLVTIYQAGQEGDIVYFAMELLDGQTLDAWLRRVPQAPVPEVLRLGREIASGLAVLHARDLVHRDIKPANIWLEAPGNRVKLLDLGLTRPVDQGEKLTIDGTILGTPGYMSPEQARGDPVDVRSDLFSLGCVLYQLCTGKCPFRGDSAIAVLSALALDAPTPVRELNAKVPEPLADLINRLLAKRPKKRPDSASAVRDELARIERQWQQPLHAIPTDPGTPRSPDSDLLELPTAEMTRRTGKKRRRSRNTKGRRRQRQQMWLMIAGASALTAVAAVVVTILLTRPAQPLANAGPDPSKPGSQKQTQKPPTDPAGHAKVYLTDLTPIARENAEFFPPDRDDPEPIPRRKAPPVSLQGKVSPHGVFIHPPPPPPPPAPPDEVKPASISYRLDGKYHTFHAKVSLNDGPHKSESPMTFAVYCDGKRKWQSKPVVTQDHTQECTVAVKDVDVLKIEVICDGEPRGAHAVWIEPWVEK